MDLEERLRLRQADVEVLSRGGKDLREKWEERFLRRPGSGWKRRIRLDQHLWHAFSHGQVEHLSGLKAEEAFHETWKEDCLVFFQNREEVLKVVRGKDIRAEDFEGNGDIYIMNDRMTWTYVHTHEADLGPYFCRVSRCV